MFRAGLEPYGCRENELKFTEVVCNDDFRSRFKVVIAVVVEIAVEVVVAVVAVVAAVVV